MRITEEENNRRRKLYLQGLSDDELMVELYLSRSAIQKWRYKNGFRHANKPKLTLDDGIDRANGQIKEWLKELEQLRNAQNRPGRD
jgi:hypothetical protein